MSKKALGLIEVVGMITAIEAADTCVKASNVQLIDYELTKGSGLVTIKIQGDIGAVKSAIEAAKASVSSIGKVFSTLVIPRPSDGVNLMINSEDKISNEKSEEKEAENKMEKDRKEIKEKEVEKHIEEVKEKEVEKHTEEVKKKEIENVEEVDRAKEIDNINKEKIEIENNEELLTEDKSEICNICKDPKCTRKKGQPKNMCIHYEKEKS